MQLVRVRHCRAKDEGCASAFRSLKVDRCLAWFEDHEFTVRQPPLPLSAPSLTRDPRNGVTARRLIRPPSSLGLSVTNK